MRVFNKEFLFTLDNDALVSDRMRSHLNLHSSFDDKVQRLLISLVKGSYVEPHYHALPHQWEMFVVIEGVIEVVFYTPNGRMEQRLLVGEGQECKVIEFAPNDIHSVKCVSDKALMLEIKEGPFSPEKAKVMANF